MELAQILLIDDSDPDLLYTQIVLESVRAAAQVLSFGTAPEALAFLRRPEGCSAELILLDINMPEMDGFAFLDIYQGLHASGQAQAAVVMLTSSPDPCDRERAARYACVRGYVVKPIDAAAARGLAEMLPQRPACRAVAAGPAAAGAAASVAAEVAAPGAAAAAGAQVRANSAL